MGAVGQLNTFKVVKVCEFGVYLDGGSLGEILLPRRYIPEECQPGVSVEVFVYFDSEDAIIATTQKPYAMVGDFALLKAVEVNRVGAFLDWGLEKDLLVPFREQQHKMEEGRSYLVRIYHDEKSNRLAASSRLDKFLDNQPADFQEGQEVKLIIGDQTDIGYKAIVENAHWGVVYKNEVFQELKKGQALDGFIKKVRDDGKIDVCLQKSGYEKITETAERVVDALKENGGFLLLTDKSSPKMIYETFGISKKTYKRAIGTLYKEKRITIENDGIKLGGKEPSKRKKRIRYPRSQS